MMDVLEITKNLNPINASNAGVMPLLPDAVRI